jgi:hypothetical protein
MARTTRSESRAWEPDPDDLASAVPAPAGDESTAEADRVALAAFAAAWTGTPAEGSVALPETDVAESPPTIEQRARPTATPFPGVPGRGVIVLSSAAAVFIVLLDFALTGGLTMFFDLCFVVICLVGAMAVRRKDLFTTGVMAPLLFGGLIAAISLAAPSTFAETGGFGTVFPTGLTEHAGALVAGYGVALLTVACRLSARR